jgi:hypothetical protein
MDIDPLNTTLPVQFVYWYSLFKATQKKGLQGFLFRGTGGLSVALCVGFAGEGVNAKNYQQVLWASQYMVDIGKAIGDFERQALGHILMGYAYHQQETPDSARAYFREGLALLPQAEAQAANNENALKNLRKWAEAARRLS